MSGLEQGLVKGAVAAADGRRPGRTDSSRGESSRGDCSRGESSRGESSRGESSRGKSSKGESWLRLGNGKSVGRKFLSLYPEFSNNESESEAVFEMKPLNPREKDEEKTDGKGKKKVDKGKAVYRDPWVNQDVSGGEQRREVEPSKFATIHPSALDALWRLTQDGQSKRKAMLRIFWVIWQT